MNRSQRLSAVLDLLAATGQVEVDEIVEKLSVSPATARRDLDSLAKQQLLTRTRGGATGQSVAYDLPLRYKRDRYSPEKQRIAEAASAMVRRGSVIGLCGGTTSTAIADVLATRPDLMESSPNPNLTVVTNALNIAVQLLMRPGIKTVVTGGIVQPRSYELAGPYSDVVLDRITLDLAFVGVNGLDPDVGATVHNEDEAQVNALMARRSQRAIVVADSSKIGKRAFATVGDADIFDAVVTDSGISAAHQRALSDHGYEVIVA